MNVFEIFFTALGFRYRRNPFKLLLALVMVAMLVGLVLFDLLWLIGKFEQFSK